MDLNQIKLSKAEWDSIEVPVSYQEKKILSMIQKGYNNINISHNDTLSLLGFLKVKESDSMHFHIFETQLLDNLKNIIKHYEKELDDVDDDSYINDIKTQLQVYSKKPKKTKPISKADSLRLTNSAKTLGNIDKDEIFEFILVDEMRKALNVLTSDVYEQKAILAPIYTINTLVKYNIYGVNPILLSFMKWFANDLKKGIHSKFIVASANSIFENNQRLLKYASQTLYSHQKKLFTVVKRPGRKVVLYTAPTGTGKTMSPIGLAEGKKVIFVCAARHVGLALAKASLSVGKRIAFAFGCQTPGDVKLHYAAAVDYIKDWRTGGIRKVDNSNGSKVEMIIADVYSYIAAMHYLLAFTDNPDDIIMYWDEPTISLDYEEHELHPLISKTWSENIIPNVILSSATLPTEEELQPMLSNWSSVHRDFDTYSIISQDFKKTIPLLGEDNRVQMPHYIAKNASELAACSKHCLTHNSIIRYIDVTEASRFILKAVSSKNSFLTEQALKNPCLQFDNVFPDIESVTLQSIKHYYCELLKYVSQEKFDEMQTKLRAIREPKYQSTIDLTTKDAHTITDGPAIYLTNNVEKVAKVFLKEANIPREHLAEIMKSIQQNNTINQQVAVIERQIEDQLQLNECKERKADLSNRRLDSNAKQMITRVENLQSQVKVVSLDDSYIPNKRNHYRKYVKTNTNTKGIPFCSDIPEGVVEEIMLINGIDDSWKILLMMGIGVFAKDLNPTYAEIMKDLAETQQLYLIIASTDYIYGTNYQFCHGYIGRDLGGISQEKCIQALGRIGRNKLQYEYSVRFRCDELLEKVFFADNDKPEATNMNKLFKISH